MSEANILLDKAFQEHQQGNFPRAEQIYNTIIAKYPKTARAFFLLGTLKCQTGQYRDAVTLLQKSLQLDPLMMVAHNSLGNALMCVGDLDQAEEHLRKAAESRPPMAEAKNNLGVVLLKKKNPKEAVQNFLAAVKYAPNNVQYQINLAEAYDALGQHDMSVPLYEKALKSAANNPTLWMLLGVAQKNLGEFSNAETSFKNACKLEPKNILAINNLAIVLKDQDKLEESLGCYKYILSLGHAPVEILFNLGLTLKEMGRFDEALECYDHAIQVQPENAMAHFNKSKILLIQEKYTEAWHEFEWRLKIPGNHGLTDCVQPMWDGSSLMGKTVFVQGEQGLGDELYHASVLHEIVETSQKCYLACHPKLVNVFLDSFPGANVVSRNLDGSCVEYSQDKNIDCFIPSGSLMRHLRPSRESFSRQKKFLKSHPDLFAKWCDRLAQLGNGPKIGISWKSLADDKSNALRLKGTTGIELWQPLLKNEKIKFVNLQYGETTPEKKYLRDQLNVDLHDWDDLDQTNNLQDVAALVDALDMVISINSAVAYLAAGLGKETWMLTAYGFGKIAGKDYRSHVFPSMQHYLQDAPGHWAELFDRVGTLLSEKF